MWYFIKWSLLLLLVSSCTSAATVRSFPNFDYGGKTHSEFLHSAIERSSPGNARVLAELFGGLELGVELGGDAQAIISVGGAATRCQHQSPCFDTRCLLCYDPLLRIHGKCGGASYFTCRGTLPTSCLPYTCTAIGPRVAGDTVFVKKFPRFEDPFCLGIGEKAQSLEHRSVVEQRSPSSAANETTEEPDLPEWALSVPDGVTACQGYDLCLDLRCGTCYDAYLGAHATCGKLTYYDCNLHLPRECQPMRCTETNIHEIFSEREPRVDLDNEVSPLMVRNFPPLEEDQQQLCV